MARQFKIVVEKTPEGYVAYPQGMRDIVMGEGETSEDAVSDLEAIMHFKIETHGGDACGE